MTTTSPTLARVEAFVQGWRMPCSHARRMHEASTWRTPLAHGQLRRFEPGAVRGLRCISGALWVTFDGDPADRVLQPGETIEGSERRAVVVYALESSVLQVQREQ